MTTMTKAQAERNRIEANKQAAFLTRVQRLLGHVGGRINQKAALAAYAAGTMADSYAFELASAEPVGQALHPQKVAAVQSAAADAQKVIDRVYAELEKHEWNLNAAAPRADSLRMGRTQYQAANAKRGIYDALTRLPEGQRRTYTSRDHDLVERDPEGAARFIEHSEQDAALQYDAFICKMVAKVGEVVSAVISGEHVWGHSILTVTLPSGEVQWWKTQQIINYSVYGRPYLQWPSRIIK